MIFLFQTTQNRPYPHNLHPLIEMQNCPVTELGRNGSASCFQFCRLQHANPSIYASELFGLHQMTVQNKPCFESTRSWPRLIQGNIRVKPVVRSNRHSELEKRFAISNPFDKGLFSDMTQIMSNKQDAQGSSISRNIALNDRKDQWKENKHKIKK